MEIDSLRWFQLVVDGETLTGVADLYMVSQPGVSRSLARLEEEVGTPLLEKRGRVLRPTHAGAVFKRHVDTMIHVLDDGLAAVSELSAPETGTVKVAFQLSLGSWLLPDLIRRFKRRYPQVRFELRISDDAASESLLEDGTADLEFTARRRLTTDAHWHRLFSQDLGLQVPGGHFLDGAQAASLAQLSSEPFVMLRRGWALRSQVDELCAAAGFAPHVAFETDDLSVVAGFVRAGLGVAVVPIPMFTTEQGTITTRDPIGLTDPGAYRDVGISWSTTRRLMPSADLFRRAVTQVLTPRSPNVDYF